MTSQSSRGRKASPDDSATSNCSSLSSYNESDHDDDREQALDSTSSSPSTLVRRLQHKGLPQSISYRQRRSSLRMNSNDNNSISPPRNIHRKNKRDRSPASVRFSTRGSSAFLSVLAGDDRNAENCGESSKYKKSKMRSSFCNSCDQTSISLMFFVCIGLCVVCSFTGHWMIVSSHGGLPLASDVLGGMFVQRPTGTKPLNVYLSGSSSGGFQSSDWSPKTRVVDTGASEVTDPSQQYHLLDSQDERDHEVMQHMERKTPFVDGDCKLMEEWQTKSFPTCNSVHEVDMAGDNDDTSVLGIKGFFRMAWKLNHPPRGESVVMKTLKMVHTYEDNFYEKHRIDALAMERLTSSPNVIDIYGYCGQTVFNELADGLSLGKLADRSSYWERLNIAIDVAEGIAAVHEVGGKDYATLVHFDINPGNVISIGGTLKLNDFNISVLRKWNTKTQKPCTFPPMFPNPQWRSPEEAKKSDYLDEKIDIYSMGNIFFRLICGKSPWGKLDDNPTKEQIHESIVQGKLPHIPSKVTKTDNPIVIAIREAMMKAYTNDPEKRPSARSIANGLLKARELILKAEKEYNERHRQKKRADKDVNKQDRKKNVATDRSHAQEKEKKMPAPKKRQFPTSRASVE